MIPEISFKVVIFEQTVKKTLQNSLGVNFEKYSKQFFSFQHLQADLSLPPPPIFSKALLSLLSRQYPRLHLKTA